MHSGARINIHVRAVMDTRVDFEHPDDAQHRIITNRLTTLPFTKETDKVESRLTLNIE